MNNTAFVFIVGSPRSGTTILGEILDGHSEISQWYEPYFIWDRHFRDAEDDVRNIRDATPVVCNQILRNFKRYQKRTGSRILVDKSPRNSLKIRFIRKIFPESKFIHILRDGRDVTLSIHKEWIKRKKIFHDRNVDDQFNYRKALAVVKAWLRRQPFLLDKMNAFWFETHGHILDKSRHLNQTRWNGATGWGPRFEGWQQIYADKSLIQFNAYQWLKCVDAIQRSWETIPDSNRMEIRYEDLIQHGADKIRAVLEFLAVKPDRKFIDSLPALKKNNFNKWKNEFSSRQLDEIQQVLTPMLISTGYERDDKW